MADKRGPYVKNKGNRCTIKTHDHAPHECPGSGKTKCAVCGKSLLKHKTMDFCTAGGGKPTVVLDELGLRRRMKR